MKLTLSSSSKIYIKCPKCFRRLAARRLNIDGNNNELIEVIHKKASVLMQTGIVKCLGCNSFFAISTNSDGALVEVDIED